MRYSLKRRCISAKRLTVLLQFLCVLRLWAVSLLSVEKDQNTKSVTWSTQKGANAAKQQKHEEKTSIIMSTATRRHDFVKMFHLLLWKYGKFCTYRTHRRLMVKWLTLRDCNYCLNKGIWYHSLKQQVKAIQSRYPKNEQPRQKQTQTAHSAVSSFSPYRYHAAHFYFSLSPPLSVSPITLLFCCYSLFYPSLFPPFLFLQVLHLVGRVGGWWWQSEGAGLLKLHVNVLPLLSNQ